MTLETWQAITLALVVPITLIALHGYQYLLEVTLHYTIHLAMIATLVAAVVMAR